MEENVIHLTLRKGDGQYALSTSVPPDQAQKIGNAIQAGMDKDGITKAEFIRRCIMSGTLEPVAQRLVAQTLDLIDSYGPLRSRAPDELAIIMDIRMSLTECDVTQMLNFSGEKSQKYIARYGDE